MRPIIKSGIVVLLAALFCQACSRGSSGSGSALAIVKIDAVAGGTLGIDSGALAGLRFVVHPGSLSKDIVISVELGTDNPELAFNSIGTAVLIRPANTVFSPPATLILPFDRDLLPDGTPDEHLEVRQRSFYGGPLGIRSLGVDRDHGQIAVPVQILYPDANLWPAVREAAASIDMAQYLPSDPIDFYRFIDGSEVQLRTPSDHANLSSSFPISELSITDIDGEGGFYLERIPNGDIARRGEFFLGLSSYQEIHDPIPWAPAIFADGGLVVAEVDYQAYAPFGSSSPAYTGRILGSTQVDLLFENFDAGIGSLTDVVRLTRREEFTDSLGGAGSFELVLFLAPGIGPVAYQLDGGEIHVLVEAVVGGKRFAGPIALLKAR